LDMLINNYHEPAVFYRNNANLLDGNWLKIKLIGSPDKQTNRDAIGAKIIVSTEGGLQVWREIHSSSGYLTMHPKQQHFGLGIYKKATVTVEWPNGDEVNFKNVPVNTSYTISQHENKIQTSSNN